MSVRVTRPALVERFQLNESSKIWIRIWRQDRPSIFWILELDGRIEKIRLPYPRQSTADYSVWSALITRSSLHRTRKCGMNEGENRSRLFWTAKTIVWRIEMLIAVEYLWYSRCCVQYHDLPAYSPPFCCCRGIETSGSYVARPRGIDKSQSYRKYLLAFFISWCSLQLFVEFHSL